MASTNIYLARHGETEFNRKQLIQGRGIDASLNETGRRQAEAIGRYMHENDIQKVYSSSLKRSQETAGIISRMYALEVESFADLDEMNFGILEGKPISDIRSELKDLHKNWKAGNVDYALENGESPRNVLSRASGKIEELIQEQPNTNLLFILHGRLIRVLLSHWLNYGLSEMDRIKHSNGAIYHLRWDGRFFDPVYLNYTEHLTSKALSSGR